MNVKYYSCELFCFQFHHLWILYNNIINRDVFKSEYFFIQFPFDKIKYKCILIKNFKHIQRFIYGTDKIYILFLNNNYFR